MEKGLADKMAYGEGGKLATKRSKSKGSYKKKCKHCSKSTKNGKTIVNVCKACI